MHSVSEALSIVLQKVMAGSSEIVPLQQSRSRVLAEDLLVPHDSPLFDKALMDGFAVHVPDHTGFADRLSGTAISFEVVEVLTAGRTPTIRLAGHLAARIMTGAPLPEGCNCVVPVEQTEFDESRPELVRIPVSVLRHEACLLRRGTAARAGSILLKAGTRVQPQQIAALAEFGLSSVRVARQPRVAVLATGDELSSIDQALVPGAIHNSNEPMLIAQIEASGAIPVGLGIAQDEEGQLRAGIQRGLEHDFFLLTGGVSAGILDLVPRQLALAGVEQHLHGVHMKPGKPLWFGSYKQVARQCLVFGLPGNPVSSLACFELFVRPALQNFVKQTSSAQALTARLSDTARVSGNRPVYHPVTVSIQDGSLTARLVPWSGSSDLKATVDANGMALLLPERGQYSAGEIVEILLWGDQSLG